MLTIEAYNETPIKVHKFLPIVSLGSDDDKYIPWGATISDNKGNYYYTSFSPAGYFLPWIFIKTFQLPITEKSLYIFNSLIFIVSGVLWTLFVSQVYKDSTYRLFLEAIALLTYVLSPEILHGMGVVYWHQSIMQVTLIIQIWAYYSMKKGGTKSAKYLFYLMVIVNPYIEWTGYVANIGFALAEFIENWNVNKKTAFAKVLFIGCLTALSFGLFIGHYLLVVEPKPFFIALKSRFMARNMTTEILLTDVFGGYLKSFQYLWILLFILVVWNFIQNGNVVLEHGYLYLVLAFPVVENIVMKQHALAYTYDRMKAVFVLSFLICELTYRLLNNAKENIIMKNMILTITVVLGIMNFRSYIVDTSYTWKCDCRESNKVIAEYVNENYPESVIAIDSNAVRGYVNLLFRRGVYEFVTLNDAKIIAGEQKKQFVVMLSVKEDTGWNLYDFGGATIYDLKAGSITKLTMNNGIVDTNYIKELKEYYLADLTDENWTSGYSNSTNTLLFEYNDALLSELRTGHYIVCDGQKFSITGVDYDDMWIRVTVDRDATICKYPSAILTE